jgi:hypothetical protein
MLASWIVVSEEITSQVTVVAGVTICRASIFLKLLTKDR